MCGIVGYVGGNQAIPVLMGGLKSLEYRGYDSAGLAVLCRQKGPQVIKKQGKLKVLEKYLQTEKLDAVVGIGHTRWATHGVPSTRNAHPHYGRPSRDFFVVHNGIIENYAELRQELRKDGCSFHSETDTEVLVHLIEKYYKGDFFQAVLRTLGRVRGSFALAIMSRFHPDTLIGARRDSPLIVGIGKQENFLASDVPAILKHTRQVIFLENDDVAVITGTDAAVYNLDGKKVSRPVSSIRWDAAQAEKSGYPHFMLKEIYEQPEVVRNILKNRVKKQRVFFENVGVSEQQLQRISAIQIVACGTAYHAGLTGKYILEKLCRIPVQVDTASEFRYREQMVDKDVLVVPVSQSGETADTLAGLRAAKEKGAFILSICNVVGSSIARESHGVLYTYAGPEIAVASTKAYTAQMMLFYLLAIYLGQIRQSLTVAQVKKLLATLRQVPDLMERYLKGQRRVKKVAKEYIHRYNYRLAEQFKFLENEIQEFKDSTKALKFAEQWARQSHSRYGRRYGEYPFLYLGRNVNFPNALEGALKLKEITYISAEGYAAGEMKHGPIALIDEFPLVVCINPQSSVYEKMLSNIREIRARKATVLTIATEGDKEIRKPAYSDYVIEIPAVDEFFSPLLVILPLQLLSYYIAAGLGCDVDQPRNLAKSVTVE